MKSAVAVVLAGCAPENFFIGIDGGTPSPKPDVVRVDSDSDGYTSEEGDCDDLNAKVGPDAAFDEVCDGLDNDCSGASDQDQFGLRVCDAQNRFDQVMKVDVLVVLDHTVSMQEYWERAAFGAGALVRHLVGTGAESHIGVISTDMSNPEAYSGRLLSPPDYGGLWLSGDDPNLDGNTRERFLVGAMTERAPQLMGAEGARAATNAALFELGDGYNNGFRRPDAPLNVVIITYDEDTSLPDNAALLGALASHAPDAKTTFYALTQTSDFGCYGQRTYPATSLISLVQATGGFYESLCLDEYTGFLSSVGQAIATDALKSTFVLDHPAQLPTVRIRTQADGHEAVEWNGGFALTDPWTLVFPDTPPPAGQAIIVDYEIDWRYEAY